MTIPAYARLAAKLLRREHFSSSHAAEVTAAARDDAIAAIERALVQRAQRRRVRRLSLLGLGAAAAAACLVWLAGGASPAPSRLASEPPAREKPTTAVAPAPPVAAPPAIAAPSQAIVVHAVAGGATVSGADPDGRLTRPGARVQALPRGRALLAFSSGTWVTLEGGGDLTLVDNTAAQVFALDRGALRADVAKLGPGQRFLVRTSDAEVEVHGTSFRVSTRTEEARCGGGTRTRVEVFEGVVTVRHAGAEVRIAAGGRWPASCAEAEGRGQVGLRQRDDATLRAGAAPPGEPGVALAPLEPPRTSAVEASLLVEQNDAFAAAVAARRAGDLGRAVRGFEALLSRFPDGPLAESAEVQRLHAMRSLDPARARELARAYLARYPNGFARAQVMAILAESP